MITLRDVARVAGVSYQTVSRTINAPSSVRIATRERVQAAIAQTGYFPNAAARRLKAGRSQLIGVVTTDLVGYGPSHTLQAFVQAAEIAGWTVFLIRLTEAAYGEHAAAAHGASLSALFENDVELVGLVGGGLPIAETIRRVRPHLPILSIGTPLPEYPVVGTDQPRAMNHVVDHLVHLGHRRIAHLAGPVDSLDAITRREGWRAAMESRGLRADIAVHGDWSASGARAAVSRWDLRDATAVTCANDQMALGAVRALRDRGWAVPTDISVVGFDDIDEAANYEPPLTTIRQPFEQIGIQAVKAIRGLSGTVAPATHHLLESDLIIRGSSAAVGVGMKSPLPRGDRRDP